MYNNETKKGEWLHVNALTSLWEAAGKFSSLLFQEIHETVITYHKSFMLYYTTASDVSEGVNDFFL